MVKTDSEMSATELQAKYDAIGDTDQGPHGQWGQHPVFTMEEWREDVANGDTRRGYWDWVQCNIETHPEDLKEVR